MRLLVVDVMESARFRISVISRAHKIVDIQPPQIFIIVPAQLDLTFEMRRPETRVGLQLERCMGWVGLRS